MAGSPGSQRKDGPGLMAAQWPYKRKTPEERPLGLSRRPVANRWGLFSPTDLEHFGASPLGGSRLRTQTEFQEPSGLHTPLRYGSFPTPPRTEVRTLGA